MPDFVEDGRTGAEADGTEPGGGYTITGTVASPDRAGLGDLYVEIVDRNVEQDVLLAHTLTDERGDYQARFTELYGPPPPDLQARVWSSEAEDAVFLAASDVRYNATNYETLDVLLPINSAALPSEYETLTGALAKHYEGQLGELEESDNRQDVTYLANKTGWDARAVAMGALADQFSKDRADGEGAEGIHRAFYYALFRAGIPANDALYQADASTVEGIWKQAMDQGVIPRVLENELSQAVQTFQRLSSARALDARAIAGTSTLSEMLNLTLGDDSERQHRFAELHTQLRGDLPEFWNAVKESFGEETAKQLQLEGQLGYLTLNNAPLMERLYEAEEENPLSAAIDLAQRGYFDADKWKPLLDGSVPDQIPGDTPRKKRDNYAEMLAAQVRLSFPTKVLAEMVIDEDEKLPLKEAGDGELPPAQDADLREAIYNFLTKNGFEIGMQPVEQYIARNDLGDQADHPLFEEVKEQIKRLQRVYQITPTDQAMKGLLDNNLDSAYQIASWDEEQFVQSFKEDLDGEDNARQTYARSQQVHNAVLNIATSYLYARTAPTLGSNPNSLIVDPTPNGQAREDAAGSDVIAYPTLEGLFGSMDYCACEHCRSILSPAAYLVDLLQFLDRPDEEWTQFVSNWKSSHDGAPYPFEDQAAWENFKKDWEARHPGQPVPNTEISPFKVLVERRPEIQHLPLTCENTNVHLPYIDVVNETLEYFVANDLSLADYPGHDTDENATTAELLANPQFVNDVAYDTLKDELFPPPLPFHKPLETLRRYFDRFEVPLQRAMETLRRNDELERPNDAAYGWRDILMEQLKLSRAEHRLLTDGALTLQQLYGYDTETPDEEVLADLSRVKAFARRVGVTYEDVIELQKTRFINPDSALIPRLKRLDVSYSTLFAFVEGDISEGEFNNRLAAGLDPTAYGGDIAAWVMEHADSIMMLITLANPTNGADLCSFDEIEFRYTLPLNEANLLSPFDYVRLLRFVRLWKKLGLTIEQTDKAVTALYPGTDLPREDLDGFSTLLPRLGIALQVMDRLNLKPNKDLLGLLACWSPIDTHGDNSLYRQMFLNPTLLKQDAAFADDGYGTFLQRAVVPYSDPAHELPQDILEAAEGRLGYDDARKRLSHTGELDTATRDALKDLAGDRTELSEAVDALYTTQFLLSHTEALRAAFNLTAEEFSLIFDALVDKLGFNTNTLLTLDNISAVYRHGWLARKLRLSVREFLLLIKYTGLDPFAPPDPPNPPITQFLDMVEALRAASLEPAQALYLIWNQDISGKAAPDDRQVTDLARNLRAGFTDIESQFAVTDDPNGDIARARMALVYGGDAADFFFGLLNNTHSVDVPYAHRQATLERPIVDAAAGRISYDDLRKRLSYSGIFSEETRNALKTVAVAGVNAAFRKAVDDLYHANQAEVGPLLSRYPELLALYEAYAFFGLLSNSTTYTHGEGTLEQAILDAAPNRIAYDADAKQLSFKGVMTEATRDKLKAVANVTGDFKAAVENLYSENQAAIEGFFNRYPTLGLQRDAYLAANDSEEERRSVLLASFLPELKMRRKRQQALVTAGAAAGTDVSFARAILDNADPLQKLSVTYSHPQAELEQAILDADPLRRIGYDDDGDRLSYTGFLFALTRDALKAVPGVTKDFQDAVDELYAAQRLTVLHSIGGVEHTGPALDNLNALETSGLSAYFFWRDTVTGTLNHFLDAAPTLAYTETGAHQLPANETTPGDPISGLWRGYLEVPEDGSYNFSVETDPDATITLTLDKEDVALAKNGNTWSNQNPNALTAGVLYPVELKAVKVTKTLVVSWQTTGRGWEEIPVRYLYSATLVKNLRLVYDRFLKASSLATGLKLTANELAHFAAHTSYSIGDQGWLNVPVSSPEDPTTLQARRKLLAALLDFVYIKAALAPDDERLLSVLQSSHDQLANEESPLLTLTRWESDSLYALLRHFEMPQDHLREVEGFRRVYDAYALVSAFGISASALIDATTNEPDADTVRDLQSALRARYEQASWLAVLKPINDILRDLQRDALVAYVLHELGQKPDTSHIDTPDKLFEYFLMDVQMEPCMETSRIRHALSSIQLFIDRCLMNLEPRVSPSAIKAAQWEWMKRYRVWEANRKVFLWPENWLEPELRDDQSPFFKEAMSELLQSDITEDAAATALLNYLSKLEEVAKLEPCGIHYEEDDDIAHVVARTAGAQRKYYYRRREPSGWTPWEQIKLDIEDNPVVPVVWKGRLLLFWLKILKQSPIVPTSKQPVPGDEVRLPELTLGAAKTNATEDVKANLKVTLQAVLCWSEYYDGKWQPVKTSDVNRPTKLNDFDLTGPYAFDREEMELDVSVEELDATVKSDALRVHLDMYRPITAWSSFLFYNTHSLPVRKEDHVRPDLRYLTESYRSLVTHSNEFYINYGRKSQDLRRYILTNTIRDRTVERLLRTFITDAPLHSLLQNVWTAPFLFEDSRHVFYVTTSSQETERIHEHAGYGVVVPQRKQWDIPLLVPNRSLEGIFNGDGLVVERSGSSIAGPSPIERFVTEDANISAVIGSSASVRYGDQDIGPRGALPNGQTQQG